MGNSQSGGGSKSTASSSGGANGATSLSRRASSASGGRGAHGSVLAAGSMSRSASGTDITEKNHTKFVQVEKLAKILQQKTHAEFGLSGICSESFVRHVFPDHVALGERLFAYLHHASKAQTRYIGTVAFRQQCERYLGILEDQPQLETFVRMHADTRSSAGDDPLLTATALSDMLRTCFALAMVHYMDDGGAATVCPLLERTIGSVTAAVFFSARPEGAALSVGFVCRWLEQNCAHLVPPVHRFCVHRLTTAYRGLGAEAQRQQQQLADRMEALQAAAAAAEAESADDAAAGAIGATKAVAALKRREVERHSVELATPVLDNANPFDALRPPLMPVSMAWLLASALPPLYSKPQAASNGAAAAASAAAGAAANGTNTVGTVAHQPPAVPQLASAAFMARMLSAVPSHWTLLYDSRQDGVGANRFLHHVLGYRGPTLCLLRADNEQVFCVASAGEWRESTVYQGSAECAVVQVMPRFALIESGPKLLYLNTTQRGYAKGLRAGSDTRKPIVSIDEHFEKLDCRGISSPLQSIEVWGCGDQRSRDVQLDIRKWQIREAERQRTVKLTAADWLDHPDRYLLELGGREQYNNSSK